MSDQRGAAVAVGEYYVVPSKVIKDGANAVALVGDTPVYIPASQLIPVDGVAPSSTMVFDGEVPAETSATEVVLMLTGGVVMADVGRLISATIAFKHDSAAPSANWTLTLEKWNPVVGWETAATMPVYT